MAIQKPQKLDHGKLLSFVEPVSVRLERITGGGPPTPVELPPKDDQPPGMGFTREEILQLEPWVAREVGGGSYEVTVTDSRGESMTWKFYYPTAKPQSMPAPGPAVVPGIPMGQLGGGGSFGGAPWATQGPQTVYQQAGGLSAFGGPQGQLPPWVFGPPVSDTSRHADEQIRQLQLQLKEQEYRAELERQRVASEQQFAAMREEMRRLAEARSATENPDTKILREELEQLKNDRQASEIAALRELIAKVAEKRPDDDIQRMREDMARERLERDRQMAEDRHRQEVLAMQAKMDQMILAAQNKSDPLLGFMQESARQQQETAREIARAQQMQTDKLTAFMMNPLQLAQLMKDQSAGVDGVLRNIVQSFGDAFGTYRTALESIAQLTGAGNASPAVEILRDGIAKGGEIAQMWLDTKKAEAVGTARAKIAQSQTQGLAIRAQAAAAARSQAAQLASGFAGAQPLPTVTAASGTNSRNGNGTIPVEVEPTAVKSPSVARKAPTDQQMFGEAWSAVQHLRTGIAAGKLTPEKAAEAILTGAGLAQEKAQKKGCELGTLVPAFTLLEDERYADLIDALLPNAPVAFREECVKFIVKKLAESDAADSDDSDDNDGNDEAEASLEATV